MTDPCQTNLNTWCATEWPSWAQIVLALDEVKYFTPRLISLFDCTGTASRICYWSQRIMSPWREQCAWCNHGNTVPETGEGTERMLPHESVLAEMKKKITLNRLNEQNGWDKFIQWETSLEQLHAACVNLQYSTCRDQEDNVSVCSSSLPSPLLYASLKSCKGSLTWIWWF